jgi:hypothetical protein
VAQNVAQPIFCQNKYIKDALEKSSQYICATSVIFKQPPKVKKHPIGKNWPNLVTLVPTYTRPDPIMFQSTQSASKHYDTIGISK